MGRDCLRCAPAVSSRRRGPRLELRMLIPAFGLHPCGADLRSVCAAWRRSSSLWWFAFTVFRLSRSSASAQVCLRQVADGEGFEPSVHCCTHAFQACAIDHSATHPEVERLVNTVRGRAASRGRGSFSGIGRHSDLSRLAGAGLCSNPRSIAVGLASAQPISPADGTRFTRFPSVRNRPLCPPSGNDLPEANTERSYAASRGAVLGTGCRPPDHMFKD